MKIEKNTVQETLIIPLYGRKMCSELLPAGEREENIGCDLNDTAWFDKNDAQDGAVFYAAGVFCYFLTDQVKALVQKMAERFPMRRSRT